MGVIEVPSVRRGRGTFTTIKLHELSRTEIAVFQMVVDGLILIVLSYVSLSFVMLLGRHDRYYIEYYTYLVPTIGTTLCTVFIFARAGVYSVLDGNSYPQILTRTIKNFIQVVFLLIGCFFIFKSSDSFSRIWLTMWTVTSTVALCGFRLAMAGAAQRLIRTGKLTKVMAVVGANAVGQRFAENLVREGLGTSLAGLFDERRSRIAQATDGGVKVHHLSALDELLCRGCVDEIVIAIPPSPSGRVLELMRRFHPFPVSLRLVSPAGYECFQILDSRLYGEFGTFCVMGKPLDEAAVVLKRLVDIIIALCCLLITLPMILLIALGIKLDSEGPVFFRQKRLGANNIPFDLLKFRSMYVDRTDPLGQRLTAIDDPRITRVGRILRRTSMDELPQLFNVLRGDMSLVGPRPHALAANAAGVPYARAISEYLIRHRVKPGITGWAQVNGWRGETVTVEQIRRRVEHDLYYIENWSLAFDFLILGRTVFAVLSRENAV